MVVVISELEIIRMRMGRVLRLLLSDVVDFRIGARVMAKVCLELLGGVVPAHVTGPRRRRRQVVWDLAGMVAAVISVSRLVSVNMRMGRISSMVGLRGDSMVGLRGDSMVGLRGDMNQVIGRVLQQVVLGDRVEVDSRIDGRMMVHVWLELEGGMTEGGMILVAARRLSERERVAHNESVLR